jgi:hypothetical protein
MGLPNAGELGKRLAELQALIVLPYGIDGCAITNRPNYNIRKVTLHFHGVPLEECSLKEKIEAAAELPAFFKDYKKYEDSVERQAGDAATTLAKILELNSLSRTA